MCRIGTFRTTLVARMLDASVAGVRCEIVNGLVPRVGDAVRLEWPDATTSPATVAWIGRAGVGLRLHGLVPGFRDRIDTASLGSECYSRLRALHAAWLAQRPE